MLNIKIEVRNPGVERLLKLLSNEFPELDSCGTRGLLDATRRIIEVSEGAGLAQVIAADDVQGSLDVDGHALLPVAPTETSSGLHLG
jgi:hypothetical protein